MNRGKIAEQNRYLLQQHDFRRAADTVADALAAFPEVEPGSDRHLGRICRFNACPKGKPECREPGCGAVPFNRQVEGFAVRADILTGAGEAMLYRRGAGRLRSALDLPMVDGEA